MPSKRRPQVRRARRPGAKTTKSKSTKARLAQPRRARKHRAIPLSKLSGRSYQARDRALHALASLRHEHRLSPTQAARLHGVRLETIQKYFPSALKKVNGKLQVTKSDRFAATLYVPDKQGKAVALNTHSSKDRTEAGEYLRDIGRYFRGDRKALLRLQRRKKIAGVELVTDERALKAIEPALSDFHLYRTFNS